MPCFTESDYMQKALHPDSSSNPSSKITEKHPEIASALQEANKHRYAASYDEALGAFGKAIDMIQQERLMNRTLQLSKARCYRQMGLIRMNQESFDEALSDFSHAAGIFETLGHQESLAEVLESMGEIELRRSCFEAALPPLRQSISLFKDSDQAPRAGRGLVLIAAVLAELGEDRVAGRRLSEGVDMASRLKDEKAYAEVLKLAGETARRLGDSESVVNYLQECIAIQGALLSQVPQPVAPTQEQAEPVIESPAAESGSEVSSEVSDIEALIEAKNEELRHFTRKAAHDMKEPLRMIASFGGLMKRKFSEGDDMLEYVEIILDAGERMQGLLAKLLEYAKVGIAEAEPSEQNLDDAVLMATADKSLAALIKERNAVVEASDLPSMIAHREYLIQAFVHLIRNAILYNTDEQPKVEFRRDPEGRGILISDNGIGIEAEHQAEIFELFRRLHSRSEYPGSGIGLATVVKIAEFYNSSVEVLESKPGEGTTLLWRLS